jgi:hypothetical protein
MPNILDTIRKSKKDYKLNEHYKYFIQHCSDRNPSTSNKRKIEKLMYITYEGMLIVLCGSRSEKAKTFKKWATKTLFTVQMGTVKQKQKLSSKLLGVSVASVKEAFNASATEYPCVYLCTFNTVDKLRKSMKIDVKYTDDMIVCKYGYTKDLSRRLSEHEKTYGKIKGCELMVKHYSIIDPMYIAEAETDVKDYFEALDAGMKYENYDELIILKQTQLKSVEKQYKQITCAYAGHMKAIIKDIEDLKKEMELREEKHKNEIMMKNNEIMMKNNEIMMKDKDNEINKEKHKNEIMMKEIELLKREAQIEKLQRQITKKK